MQVASNMKSFSYELHLISAPWTLPLPWRTWQWQGLVWNYPLVGRQGSFCIWGTEVWAQECSWRDFWSVMKGNLSKPGLWNPASLIRSKIQSWLPYQVGRWPSQMTAKACILNRGCLCLKSNKRLQMGTKPQADQLREVFWGGGRLFTTLQILL